MFARVEEDQTERIFHSVTDNGTGQVTETYTVRRAVTTNFQVYDLPTGRVVWSGDVSREREANNGFGPASDGTLWSWVESFIPETRGSADYPTPPALDGVLGDCFRAFADNLPKHPES